MVQIRFTKYGSCTATGNFEPGTLARVGEAMARHLVEDIRVAAYVQAKPAPAAEAEPAAEPTPTRKRGRR